MYKDRLYSYGKFDGADSQRRSLMAAAQRKMSPISGAPPAPNLSSRISPGTVPMKKGMR